MLKLMRWFAVLLFLMLLQACQKDPVVEDLEAFNALGSEIFGSLKHSVKKTDTLDTPSTVEGGLAELRELIGIVEPKVAKLKTFEAKSPKVKEQADKIIDGFNYILKGCKTIEEALKVAKKNPPRGQDTFLRGAKEYAEGGQKIREALDVLSLLAKEKGVEWKVDGF